MEETNRDEHAEQKSRPGQELVGRVSLLVAGVMFMSLGLLFAFEESTGKPDPSLQRRIFLAMTSAFMISSALSKTKLPSKWSIKFGMGDLLRFSGFFFIQVVLQQVLSSG